MHRHSVKDRWDFTFQTFNTSLSGPFQLTSDFYFLFFIFYQSFHVLPFKMSNSQYTRPPNSHTRAQLSDTLLVTILICHMLIMCFSPLPVTDCGINYRGSNRTRGNPQVVAVSHTWLLPLGTSAECWTMKTCCKPWTGLYADLNWEVWGQ